MEGKQIGKDQASENVSSALKAISSDIDSSYGRFYDIVRDLKSKQFCNNFDEKCGEIEHSINDMKSDYGYAEFWMTKLSDVESPRDVAIYLRKMKSFDRSIKRLETRLNNMKDEVIYETDDKGIKKGVKPRDSWLEVLLDKKVIQGKNKEDKVNKGSREVKIKNIVDSKNETFKKDEATLKGEAIK